MQKILLSTFFTFLISFQTLAQLQTEAKPDFGLGEAALILLDSGYSKYNENFELIFTHTTSIEIVKKEGLDWAKVMIPYSDKDSLIFIKGKTYNLSDSNSLIGDSLKSNQSKSEIKSRSDLHGW